MNEPALIKRVMRALRHRNYRLYFSGQLISVIGTWMQNTAQSWLVYRLTHSAFLLGLVGFAGQIPNFVLGPFAGLLVDRCRKRRLIIATQIAALCQAALMAILTLNGTITTAQVFVLALILGIVNAVDIPARHAFVVEMVAREDMLNAIALNSTVFNGARIIGPAIAGVLVATLGEGYCFALNAVSYVAVVIGLYLMQVEDRVASPTAVSTLKRLEQGFQYVHRTQLVRSSLLLLGLTSVVAMPYSVLMPIFADSILHSGARGLGILMGASGVGAVAGALVIGSRADTVGLERLIAWGCAGFCVALGAFALSRHIILSALLLIPAGFLLMIQTGSTNMLIQSMVPDELRGRVMSLYSMMFTGMAPFGSLLAGAAAKLLGAPTAVATGAAVCVLGALVFHQRLRKQAADAGTALQTGR